MTKVQIVLLFTKTTNLSEIQKEKIEQIVSEEYCREFTCKASSLEIELCNGTGAAVDNYDVVLAISSDKKILNEGSLRDNLRKSVGKRLWNFLPKGLGFRGQVGTMDGQIEKEPYKNNEGTSKGEAEKDRSDNYVAVEPRMTFEMLQLPDSVLKEIEHAIKRIELEREIFEDWGLYAIMPNPVCALSFYGAPGTGKTLAADAIASHLGKKIIRASYADIESKYHGEGPKNVEAIFRAAENQDALLFIDEADSLLSKRLTNVTQGSEQAINSMRSQILICLERFHGIVIFATNLVVNYDKAFVSRLTGIEFKLPDAQMRERIWRAHLYPDSKAKVQLKIPLADDVDLAELAKAYEVCGREIRNAEVNACVEARMQKSPFVTNQHLVNAINWEISRAKNLAEAKDHTDLQLKEENQATLERIISDKIIKSKERSA